MANTYTSLHYHIVFSTKHRYPWISPEIEQEVWAYLGGIARTHGLKALQIGGIEEHIHILLGAPPTMTVSKATQLIKGGSSKWIHEAFLHLRDFRWQDGYGAFTVSKSGLETVAAYISSQREHHKSMTFKIELLGLLERHKIEFDERYLWE